MKEILKEALALIKQKTQFAVATVMRTWGSAPRKVGAHMLVTEEMIIGSVSGGCVENEVFTHARELIGHGGCSMLHYGVSDEDAWQVGLSCGGKIDLFVECFNPDAQEDVSLWNTLESAILQDTGAVIVRKLAVGPAERDVWLPGMATDSGVLKAAHDAYLKRAHQVIELEGRQYFIEVVPPRHRVLIFGAAHIAAELVPIAKQFDFHTTVIDPRGFFTDKTSFPVQPDTLHVQWPAEILHEIPLTPYTYAVTLSHDPKIDDQALEILLKSEVAYIGALGGRKSNAARLERLRAIGFDDATLDRIHAPVGVDIHAQSAREIALSILAELVAVKNKNL